MREGQEDLQNEEESPSGGKLHKHGPRGEQVQTSRGEGPGPVQEVRRGRWSYGRKGRGRSGCAVLVGHRGFEISLQL